MFFYGKRTRPHSKAAFPTLTEVGGVRVGGGRKKARRGAKYPLHTHTPLTHMCVPISEEGKEKGLHLQCLAWD